MNGADDQLWVDIYEPTTEADLAVHIRKVEDVRRWLTEAFNGGPSGKLKKYRVCFPVQCIFQNCSTWVADTSLDWACWNCQNYYSSCFGTGIRL